MLNDALAVKASPDEPMLRPMLSAARAVQVVGTAAADAASPPSTPTGGDDKLSSFLVRSQEKRKRFSSSLKLLMSSREGTDGRHGLRLRKEKEVTIGWRTLFLFMPLCSASGSLLSEQRRSVVGCILCHHCAERSSDGSIGVRISRRSAPNSPHGAAFFVTILVPGGPAEMSNQLLVGDEVIKINGSRVTSLSMEEVRWLLSGAPQTKITLTTFSAEDGGSAHESLAQRASDSRSIDTALWGGNPRSLSFTRAPHAYRAPPPPITVTELACEIDETREDPLDPLGYERLTRADTAEKAPVSATFSTSPPLPSSVNGVKSGTGDVGRCLQNADIGHDAAKKQTGTGKAAQQHTNGKHQGIS